MELSALASHLSGDFHQLTFLCHCFYVIGSRLLLFIICKNGTMSRLELCSGAAKADLSGSEALFHRFLKIIGKVNPFAIDKAIEDTRSLHSSEGFHKWMKKFGSEAMDEIAISFAGAPEGVEYMFGNIDL
jgi:hypothetical protein